jgi:hypothetical protein
MFERWGPDGNGSGKKYRSAPVKRKNMPLITPLLFQKNTIFTGVFGCIKCLISSLSNRRNLTCSLKTVVPNGKITGAPMFVKQFNIVFVIVWVIEYLNLRFICNLVLEIWDFTVFV